MPLDLGELIEAGCPDGLDAAQAAQQRRPALWVPGRGSRLAATAGCAFAQLAMEADGEAMRLVANAAQHEHLGSVGAQADRIFGARQEHAIGVLFAPRCRCALCQADDVSSADQLMPTSLSATSAVASCPLPPSMTSRSGRPSWTSAPPPPLPSPPTLPGSASPAIPRPPTGYPHHGLPHRCDRPPCRHPAPRSARPAVAPPGPPGNTHSARCLAWMPRMAGGLWGRARGRRRRFGLRLGQLTGPPEAPRQDLLHRRKVVIADRADLKRAVLTSRRLAVDEDRC